MVFKETRMVFLTKPWMLKQFTAYPEFLNSPRAMKVSHTDTGGDLYIFTVTKIEACGND